MSHCVGRPLTFLAVVGAVLVLAACGSHSESPLAPSGLQSSATINGTVQTGVGASSTGRQPNASAAGIQVSIEGTGLSATTDPAGRFVLSGAPTGSATLRFEGPGIDARLKLSGLIAGQVLTIEVQVSGGRAVLMGSADDSPSASPTPSPTPSPSASPNPGDDDEVEFRGAVEAVNPPDLTVAGRLVHTDTATDIKKHGDHITLADILVGDLVEVEGAPQADGSVLATKIRVENDQNEDGDGDDDEDQDGEPDDDGDNGGGNGGNGGNGGGGDDDDDGHN